MSFITINKEKIHYYQSGDISASETLVFLPGSAMTGESMKMYADFFKNYNCISIDYPAHGKSEGKSIKTVEKYADFTEDLISILLKDKIISDNITVVGYSMGGFISMELAIRKFPYIKRMIILHSATGFADGCEFAEDFKNFNVEDFDLSHLLEYVTGRNIPAPNSLQMQNIISDNAPKGVTCFNDLMTGLYFNKIDKLKEIDIPTLVIAGDDDRCIPIKYVLKLKENIPKCDLAVFPYIGHVGPYQEFDYYVKIISDFLKYNK